MKNLPVCFFFLLLTKQFTALCCHLLTIELQAYHLESNYNCICARAQQSKGKDKLLQTLITWMRVFLVRKDESVQVWYHKLQNDFYHKAIRWTILRFLSPNPFLHLILIRLWSPPKNKLCQLKILVSQKSQWRLSQALHYCPILSSRGQKKMTRTKVWFGESWRLSHDLCEGWSSA